MKVMVILGTRPEGIKMAPIINLLKKDKDIECIFVNTAQHREMLDQVLKLFKIQPDYDLNVMKSGQELDELTSTLISKLSPIIEKEQPNLVLVHGDTTSTLAGAYTSFLKKIPIGHVEAGLRTNQQYSPFPEEINRQLVSRLATFHFAPTESNKDNLLKENIKEENIAVVGNTVVDALLDVASRKFEIKGELNKIMNTDKKIILMTTHRRENFNQLYNVYEAINKLIVENEDILVLFPVHKNPVIREQVERGFIKNPRIHLIEPLDYEAFVHVMKQSFIIVTDSGGIQEEAPSLGKPVLVVRNTTERIEGVQSGTIKLVGTSKQTLFLECHKLLNSSIEYQKMINIKNPYGDGQSSRRVIEYIKSKFGI